jgi:RNA-binding protein
LSCANQTEENTVKGEDGGSQAVSKLTAETKRRIKRELSGEKPTIWIGKNQASKEILREIEKQLEKKEMVKVRILKSGLQGDDAKGIASGIAEKTQAALIEVRGHTFMLYKRRRKDCEK